MLHLLTTAAGPYRADATQLRSEIRLNNKLGTVVIMALLVRCSAAGWRAVIGMTRVPAGRYSRRGG
jgi:hypothetical protein